MFLCQTYLRSAINASLLGLDKLPALLSGLKFAEGLLYEAVAAALGCGTVRDGECVARYDLRVLVMDQVPYGPYVPVRQPVALPFIQVCHTYAAPARRFIIRGVQDGRRSLPLHPATHDRALRCDF